mmetsp:Transcript_37741/g.44017  ORF Transcript_37741/g.44017 Transcript_37741/m.44017 type:complete len:131 (-) Transcript_37741:162-554(-)
MCTPFDKVDKTTHDEMCCTYAALILQDEGLEISGEKINKLIAASGNKVDAYWPGLFARALHGKNVSELLLGGGGAAGGSTGGAAKTDAPKADAKKDDKKEPAKKETKKEEPKPADDDVDMGGGLGLFDDF